MKATELRIGNWFKVEDNDHQQWELSDFADSYYDHNAHEYYNSINPIPLTPEWLEAQLFNQ